MEFYGIMEEDPALTENRDRALEILRRAGEDYEKAEDSYAKARELANSNPDVIKLPPAAEGESSTATQESAPAAPENEQGGETDGG
jgi:hypothetical protein